MHAHGYNEEMALSAGLDMTQEEYYVPRSETNPCSPRLSHRSVNLLQTLRCC